MVSFPPLTTVFKPPPACSTQFTAPLYGTETWPAENSVVHNFQGFGDSLSCYPSGFPTETLDPYVAYSPGICPMGYTTATSSFVDGTMWAFCCSIGYNLMWTLGPETPPSDEYIPCEGTVYNIMASVYTWETPGTFYPATPEMISMSTAYPRHLFVKVAWETTDLGRFPEAARPTFNTHVPGEAEAAAALEGSTKTSQGPPDSTSSKSSSSTPAPRATTSTPNGPPDGAASTSDTLTSKESTSNDRSSNNETPSNNESGSSASTDISGVSETVASTGGQLPTDSDNKTSGNNSDTGLSASTKIAIGVGAGVGVTLLIAIIAVFFFLKKRRKSKPELPIPEPLYENDHQDRTSHDGDSGLIPTKQQQLIGIMENQVQEKDQGPVENQTAMENQVITAPGEQETADSLPPRSGVEHQAVHQNMEHQAVGGIIENQSVSNTTTGNQAIGELPRPRDRVGL